MKKYCLDGEIASFDVHDEEGFWSFCGPKSLKKFLDTLSAGEKAEIEINSPGGSVIAGVEMCNMIKNSPAHLIAHVTGLAASMASVVACACDEIVMEEASFMIMHDPWTVAEGNAEEFRKNADVLDQMKAVIISFYRGKFQRTDEELSALMGRETYMTANECAENGLKCRVVKSDVRFAAKLTARSLKGAPEAVAKFMKSAEMPAAVKAAVEKARAELEAPPAGPSTNGTSSQPAKGGASNAENRGEVPQAPKAPAQEPKTGSSGSSPKDDTTNGEDWEARYKGASKKINELQAKIAELAGAAAEQLEAVVKERDGLKAQVAALEETGAAATKALKDFEDQVKASGHENLAALVGAVSSLRADLEKSGKDLAESRQQLDHMKKTRDLLTGGVLTPSDGETYEAKMKDPNSLTVTEREKLRAKKRAGKIK